jgi:hypothetical protein
MSELQTATSTKVLSNWEKIDILLKALVPISIAGAGWFINDRLAEGNREAERARSLQVEQQAQEESRRQGLAALPQFLDALVSDDPRRKKIAIETINRLLPDDGAAILTAIADDKTQPDAVRIQATNLAQQGIRELVNRMFDQSSSTNRRMAYASLSRGNFDPPTVIRELLARGTSDVQNKNGTYNAISFLGNMAPEYLRQFQDEIRKYAENAKSNGPDTAGLADNLIARL